jgi:hypothetical protein
LVNPNHERTTLDGITFGLYIEKEQYGRDEGNGLEQKVLTEPHQQRLFMLLQHGLL